MGTPQKNNPPKTTFQNVYSGVKHARGWQVSWESLDLMLFASRLARVELLVPRTVVKFQLRPWQQWQHTSVQAGQGKRVEVCRNFSGEFLVSMLWGRVGRRFLGRMYMYIYIFMLLWLYMHNVCIYVHIYICIHNIIQYIYNVIHNKDILLQLRRISDYQKAKIEWLNRLYLFILITCYNYTCHSLTASFAKIDLCWSRLDKAVRVAYEATLEHWAVGGRHSFKTKYKAATETPKMVAKW